MGKKRAGDRDIEEQEKAAAAAGTPPDAKKREGGTNDEFKDKFSKKRKSASSNTIVSWVSGTITSSTGSNTSGAGSNTSSLSKRSRADNSISLDTATSQTKSQLPVSSEPPMLSDEVTSPLLMTAGKLSKETAAILSRLTPSALPDVEDRLSITDANVELQHALIQLRIYARVHANHPAPPAEELSRIVGLLEDAADLVIRSMVLDDEDRLFLLGRGAADHAFRDRQLTDRR